MAREFLQVDPRTLRLPHSRRQGADPAKLQRQISRHGASVDGMPHLEVVRGIDGFLLLVNGVTRATRVAKLLPGTMVAVEVISAYPKAVGHLPSIEDMLP